MKNDFLTYKGIRYISLGNGDSQFPIRVKYNLPDTVEIYLKNCFCEMVGGNLGNIDSLEYYITLEDYRKYVGGFNAGDTIRRKKTYICLGRGNKETPLREKYNIPSDIIIYWQTTDRIESFTGLKMKGDDPRIIYYLTEEDYKKVFYPEPKKIQDVDINVWILCAELDGYKSVLKVYQSLPDRHDIDDQLGNIYSQKYRLSEEDYKKLVIDEQPLDARPDNMYKTHITFYLKKRKVSI